MSSVSEKGHAMNAAHFDELLQTILTIEYKPSKDRLKPESMKTMSADIKNVMSDLIKALASFKTTTDARELAFEEMVKIASRIINILKSLDLQEGTVDSCKQILRKIQGRRASAKRSKEQVAQDAADGISVREISSSQRSYDNQLMNFNLLYEQLNNIPEYQPNETGLKKEAIKAMADDLKLKNEAVVSARAALKDARSRRDILMYKKSTGLVAVATDVKAYIKGAFGPSSAEFKKVQKIEFRKN